MKLLDVLQALDTDENFEVMNSKHILSNTSSALEVMQNFDLLYKEVDRLTVEGSTLLIDIKE